MDRFGGALIGMLVAVGLFVFVGLLGVAIYFAMLWWGEYGPLWLFIPGFLIAGAILGAAAS